MRLKHPSLWVLFLLGESVVSETEPITDLTKPALGTTALGTTTHPTSASTPVTVHTSQCCEMVQLSYNKNTKKGEFLKEYDKNYTIEKHYSFVSPPPPNKPEDGPYHVTYTSVDRKYAISFCKGRWMIQNPNDR